MTTQIVHLKAKTEAANGTIAFHLEKPQGFEFRPGQAIDVILADAGEARNTGDGRHAFSIVSAPHESELVFATRMRDSVYKRALAALPVGAELDIDGPFGSLTLHKNTARAGVLIAGGIGVTPFMSMLRNAAMQQSQQDLLLLYSNRRPEDSAFLSELQALERTNPKFRLKATMTDMAHSAVDWSGDTQTIDREWLQQAIEGLANPIFYVAGPPSMVAAMQQLLLSAGIDEDDVRSEEFFGY